MKANEFVFWIIVSRKVEYAASRLSASGVSSLLAAELPENSLAVKLD